MSNKNQDNNNNNKERIFPYMNNDNQYFGNPNLNFESEKYNTPENKNINEFIDLLDKTFAFFTS